MKKASLQGEEIEVEFRVKKEEWQATIDQVKTFRGRQFHPDRKVWTVPVTLPNIRKLQELGYSLDASLKKLIMPPLPPEPQAPINESLLPKGLRPYQLQALRFLEAVKGRGYLAMFPRAGKSIVALSYLRLHPELAPVLIICPSSAKLGWQREVTKWLGEDSHVICGTTPYPLPDVNFHIINYDILYAWKDYLKGYKYVVVDEAHRVSNLYIKAKNKEGKAVTKKVQCTEAFTTISKDTPHIVFLSGTPFTSRVRQLFVAFKTFSWHTDYHKFSWRYCDPKKGQFGWTFDGISHEDELLPDLAKFMFRRKREDVFSELPEESHEFIPIEIDQKQYEKELAEFKEWVSSHPNIDEETIHKRLAQFESLSYSKKRTQILTWLKEYLETGNKVVVFTWHRQVTEDIYNTFKKQAVIMYGGISLEDKKEAEDKFNTDPECLMFVGNIKSAKEAISLYASDVVVYAELPMVPGDLEQSQQRIYLPEKNKHKFNYLYFTGVGTADENRVRSLISRARLIGRVLDGNEETSPFGSVLDDL